jgi:hypothetical protein
LQRGGTATRRESVVAGSFYPASERELIKMIEKFTEKGAKKERAIAVFSPHAGYVYSGGVAGALFSRVEVPQRVIILTPNHTGLGAPISLFPDGVWEIPTGEVQIDSQMNTLIRQKCELVEEDSAAHLGEHSAEVQLPFLKYHRSDVTVSVIVLATHDYSELESLGTALAQTVTEVGKDDVLLLASTDMTHFEPHSRAVAKDKLAIEKMLALDPRGLLMTVQRERISMCGVAPATAVLLAAKLLGASRAQLVKYETSGDVTGDNSSVVGYAGVMVW